MMTRRGALMATAGATVAAGLGRPPAAKKQSRIRKLLAGPVTGTPAFPAPANDPAGAGDYGNISQNAGQQAWLLPGQYYLSADIVLSTAGQQLYGCGPGTVINQGSSYPGSGGLFRPAASSVRLSNFAVNVTPVPFIDFSNAFLDYPEIGHITVTAGTAGMSGPAAGIFTSPDFHRPAFHDLVHIQNRRWC
jgi:hypothetical protein